MTDKIVRDAVCTDTGFDDEARAWVTNTREEVGMLMSCDSVRITIEPACDGRVDSKQ